MSISHVYECESHATVQQEKEMKMLLTVKGGSKKLYVSQNFELTSKTWFYKLPAAISPFFYQKKINNVLNFIRS